MVHLIVSLEYNVSREGIIIDFNKLKEELEKSGKADKLASVANSADGKRLVQKLNNDEIERAAKTGDTEALQNILKQVLSTDEGKRLAQQLGDAMK